MEQKNPKEIIDMLKGYFQGIIDGFDSLEEFPQADAASIIAQSKIARKALFLITNNPDYLEGEEE